MRHQWMHVETILARICPHSEDSRVSPGTYEDCRITPPAIMLALCRGLDDIGRNELLETCHADSGQHADELGYVPFFEALGRSVCTEHAAGHRGDCQPSRSGLEYQRLHCDLWSVSTDQRQ